MKGSPARPGGSSKSKPMWLGPLGFLTTSAFSLAGGGGVWMKNTYWLIVGVLFVMPALPAHAWIITQVEPNPLAGQAVGLATHLAGPVGSDVFEIDKYFIVDPNDAASPLPLTLRFVRQAGDQNLITIGEGMRTLQVCQNRVCTVFH